MSMDFDISGIVDAVGETFTISGVSRTYNDYGDPTETFNAFVCKGEVQVMDGTEDEVEEGILNREDIIVFVDENYDNAGELKVENYINLSGTVSLTSGVFRIINVIHNPGHYEVDAKRVTKA